MCGLFGSIGFAPDERRIDIVAHRGPDGRGWMEFSSPAGPVALGHRRLAIIDLSAAGLNPMADPTGRYHLVFNGEIYNFIELREELRARGEIFTTATDSEVLLRAYVIWGEAALDRLSGMFAFLIWDDRDKTLLVARDRFGIKPLYFIANAHGVAFASEIKQLLGLPGVAVEANLARVHDFLDSGSSDHTDETLFRNVLQVRGGECIRIDAAHPTSMRPAIRRWHSRAIAAMPDLTEVQASERFRALFDASIKRHLRSDVPVGSCLSGGLDSSSIVCAMARELRSGAGGARVRTVSACYPGEAVDERPYVDAVVAQARADADVVFPRPEDVFTLASEITWHQDEPFGSTSIVAQWCVFGAARRAGIKVMLDGQGADEQLAGYHTCFAHQAADFARRGEIGMLWQALRDRRALHGVAFANQIRQLLPHLLPDRMLDAWRRHRHRSVLHDWLNSDVRRDAANRADGLAAARPKSLAEYCAAATYATSLPQLLHWEDRNSMAHSIEARVPFLDPALATFALALGDQHRIAGGETKYVLRRAMDGILPDMVRDRRDKIGFATPEQNWFRGPLRRLANDGVEATLRRFPDLLNPSGTRALVADMLEGRRLFDFRLWRIINLGIWGERFGVTL
jgi:asparagine synthase (glutamine-hydrolysing)